MSSRITLKGLIIPDDWDRKDKVMGVILTTAGEIEYQIVMDEVGKTLVNHIRCIVQLEGDLTKQADINLIRVNSYKLLNRK